MWKFLLKFSHSAHTQRNEDHNTTSNLTIFHVVILEQIKVKTRLKLLCTRYIVKRSTKLTCHRSSHRMFSIKKAVFKKKPFWPANLVKRDSNTVVFLQILRNSSERPFWKTNGCFCCHTFNSHIFLCKINYAHIVGNKAKRQISKRVLQENKARQIFQKTILSYPWYAHACHLHQ